MKPWLIVQGIRQGRSMIVGWQDGTLYGDGMAQEVARQLADTGAPVSEAPEAATIRASLKEPRAALLTLLAVFDRVTKISGDVPPLSLGAPPNGAVY